MKIATRIEAAVVHLVVLAALTLALVDAVHAQPLQCEIGGQYVNPANGSTTAGKTGIMRCRDSEGRMQREEELRDGKFVGLRTFYERDGGKRVGNVNERGNSDGLQREYWPDGSLKREETTADGSTIGIARTFYPGGRPQRISHLAPRQENLGENSIEFNQAGQVTRLYCAPRNRLKETEGPCGFAGRSDTPLYSAKGDLIGRDVWEEGRLRQRVSLNNGKIVSSIEATDAARVERSFHPDGTTVRTERQFALDASGRAKSPRDGSEREFAASGQVTRETRWVAGIAAEEREWYLNGQRKYEALRTGAVSGAGTGDTTPPTKVRQFWDNGKLRVEEERSADGNRGSGRVIGLQKVYREDGSLQQENVYSARGYRERMREYDAGGKVMREEEYFEDGSRKSPGR